MVVEATVVWRQGVWSTLVISASVPTMANLVDETIRHDVFKRCTCVLGSATGIKCSQMLELVHVVDVRRQILGQQISIGKPLAEKLDILGPVVGRRGDWNIVEGVLGYWGLSGNPGGDLLGDGEPLDAGLGEGVNGGVAAAAFLDGVGAAAAGLDGDVAADEAAGDRAPDEVQLSSSPRS